MSTMQHQAVPDGPGGNGVQTDVSVAPLLLTARQAAKTCGKSLRTWRTWDSAGWIPQPIRIGRSTLWRADELRQWVDAGCPRREEWGAGIAVLRTTAWPTCPK